MCPGLILAGIRPEVSWDIVIITGVPGASVDTSDGNWNFGKPAIVWK